MSDHQASRRNYAGPLTTGTEIIAAMPLDLTAYRPPCAECARKSAHLAAADRELDHRELQVAVRDTELARLRREVAALRRDTPGWHTTALAVLANAWGALVGPERHALTGLLAVLVGIVALLIAVLLGGPGLR